MPIHAYMQMPTAVANITTCITQVTLKLVNYALLVNKLWFGLACLELLGNFPTDKHGLDCCLQLDTKVFQRGLNRAPQLETKVYVKPTNTGLLLHYQSHVDNRYKQSLFTAMLDRAYRLSSSWAYFSEECERLKSVFSRLKYPQHLINSTINIFVNSRVADQ